MTPSTSAAGDDARLAQLDRELRDLAARTVHRAFDVVQGRGALPLPVLSEIAAATRPGWPDLPGPERAGVLAQVMVRAVRTLPADVAVPDTTMSWRRLGQIIFDLGPFDDRVMNAVIVETGENRYNRLVAYARRESGFTKSNQTFSDRIAKLRQRVAAALRDTGGDPGTAMSLPPGRAPAAVGAYVADHFFEALLQRLSAAAPELVSLVGEPGIGKSRLAREVCERLLASSEVVWLRAGDERDLYDDIAEFLRANGMAEVGPVLADAMLAFQRFLSRDSAPPTVVLDGVADLRTVHALIGPAPRRPVIATSHAPLAEPAPTPMRGLRPSAAIALARSLAPDLPRWQAAAIGAMTGGRPGLIRGIVALLGGSTGHLDLFDVWHGLQTRPSAIIELIEPVAGNRLSSFYASRMRRLREQDPHTAATVELAALHELDYTSPEIVARSLRHLHRLNHHMAQAVVARTYAMLPRYGLQYPSRDPLVSALVREQGGPTLARAEELRAALARDLAAQADHPHRGGLTDLVAGLHAVENLLGDATAVMFSGPSGTELFDEQGLRHTVPGVRPTRAEAVGQADPRGERIRFVREIRFHRARPAPESVHVDGTEVQSGALQSGAVSWVTAYSGAVRHADMFTV